MQIGSIASPGGALQAPCSAPSFLLTSSASFTVQYVDEHGAPVGVAAPAQQYAATSFMAKVVAPRNSPFVKGAVLALVVGTATVYAFPETGNIS